MQFSPSLFSEAQQTTAAQIARETYRQFAFIAPQEQAALDSVELNTQTPEITVRHDVSLKNVSTSERVEALNNLTLQNVSVAGVKAGSCLNATNATINGSAQGNEVHLQNTKVHHGLRAFLAATLINSNVGGEGIEAAEALNLQNSSIANNAITGATETTLNNSYIGGNLLVIPQEPLERAEKSTGTETSISVFSNQNPARHLQHLYVKTPAAQQVVKLSGKTEIKGDVVFESGNGLVLIEGNQVKLHGKVHGGKVVQDAVKEHVSHEVRKPKPSLPVLEQLWQNLLSAIGVSSTPHSVKASQADAARNSGNVNFGNGNVNEKNNVGDTPPRRAKFNQQGQQVWGSQVNADVITNNQLVTS
jgi:hypothetical protein